MGLKVKLRHDKQTQWGALKKAPKNKVNARCSPFHVRILIFSPAFGVWCVFCSSGYPRKEALKDTRNTKKRYVANAKVLLVPGAHRFPRYACYYRNAGNQLR